jgi:hypothetical protein
MATVHVDRRAFGDGVRKPSRAFLSGYASPIEKLGILHTVYSRLGWDPVAIVTLRHDPGGALRLHPDNVEGLWVRIAVQGRLLYLDATSTSGPGEPRSDHVFVLDRKGIEPATFVRPATTRMRLSAVMDLTAEVPLVKGTVTLRGSMNPYWKLFTSGGGCPVETVRSVLGAAPGFEVETGKFARMALDETIVAFTASPVIEDGVVDVTLPSLLASTIEGWETWRPSRDLPLPIDEKTWEKVRVEIRLPEGATVLYAPTFDETQAQAGPVSMFHSKGQDASHVAISRRVTLEEGQIDPGDMEQAVALLASALAPNSNRMTVKLPAPK